MTILLALKRADLVGRAGRSHTGSTSDALSLAEFTDDKNFIFFQRKLLKL